MEDDGGIVYPGNALPNPFQSSRYTILKWKKFNINPQVAMDYEPTTGNTSLLVPKAINFDWDFPHESTVNYILTDPEMLQLLAITSLLMLFAGLIKATLILV